MDIERLKKKKAELGYTNKDIAELSGVPLSTVQKIFGTATKTPRRETYLALARLLDPEGADSIRNDASYVREEAVPYEVYREKRQGEYTVEDYYAFPDDIRVELIDGVIYYMTAPTSYHQLIAGEVHRQLWDCAEAHGSDCFPFMSPIDVQLDRDERTMVQPDVIIVCGKDLMRKKVIYGAPEFIMEVLSPSTKDKDLLIKLSKYRKAGCQEVWMVDPDKRRVTVYDFTSDSWPDIYSFDEHVPLAISEGKCEIDFTKVRDKMDKYAMFSGEK